METVGQVLGSNPHRVTISTKCALNPPQEFAQLEHVKNENT